MKVLCLLFVLIAAASATTYSLTNGTLVELNDAQFNQSKLDFPYLLVRFYSPTCPWCKQFAPQYLAAAKQIKAANLGVTPAQVNVIANTRVRQQINIEHHPNVIEKVDVRALNSSKL